MPPRAQCIVHRGNRLLMVKHRHQGLEWWCLPGGGVEEGETPAEAVVRELREECNVEGTVVRQSSVVTYHSDGVQAYTYLVDRDPGARPRLCVVGGAAGHRDVP